LFISIFITVDLTF